MSEESNSQQSAEPETDEPIQADPTDWLLQAIISGYADHGVEISVTVTVGGSIVSGMLISGRSYFEEMRKMLSAQSKEDGDIFALMAEDFGSMGPDVYDKPKDAADDWKPNPSNYVHLKGARFHAPGQNGIPAKDGFLWRGKLSSVDAFNIGSFGASAPSDNE